MAEWWEDAPVVKPKGKGNGEEAWWEAAPLAAAPPPAPPEDVAPLLGGEGASISPTPPMQGSLASLLGYGPALDKLKELSGPGGEALVESAQGVTPMDVFEAGPPALATAGAMAAGPANIPLALLMAGVGGMGGVGFKRLGQWLNDAPIVAQDKIGRMFWPEGVPTSMEGDLAELFGEGFQQAGFEAFGQFMAKALRAGAKPEGIVALAEELGLPPPPKKFHERLARKTILGEGLAVRAARRGEEEAMERAARDAATLGQPPPLPDDSALKYTRDVRSGFAKSLEKAGREAVDRGLTRAEGEVSHLIKDIAPEVDPPTVIGRRAQGAAKRGAHLARTGPAGANELYSRADALNEGTMVDITDHFEFLKDMLEDARLAPSVDPGALTQYIRKIRQLAKAEEDEELMKAVAGLGYTNPEDMTKVMASIRGSVRGEPEEAVPVEIPYKQARELQKWLGQKIDKRLTADIAQGRIQQMWESVTGALEEAVAGTEGKVALAEANRFYRGFKDIVDKSAVSKMVEGYEKNPEKILQVMGGGPSNVRYLRKAIIGFAEKHGDLKEQAAAHKVWDQMGRLFAEEKLLNGGIEQFPDKIASAEMKETLQALYGREMANNMQQIASSVRALKNAKGWKPNAVEKGALDRLEALDHALRYVGKVGEGGGIGMYRYGSGIALPVRLLLGTAAAATTGGTVEIYGGLLTWAAVNRARTRAFRNAAAAGFRVGAPATLRLINSYLDYQRDMALLEEKRAQGGPPEPPKTVEPGTSVEITPETLKPPPSPPEGFHFPFLD